MDLLEVFWTKRSDLRSRVLVGFFIFRADCLRLCFGSWFCFRYWAGRMARFISESKDTRSMEALWALVPLRRLLKLLTSSFTFLPFRKSFVS